MRQSTLANSAVIGRRSSHWLNGFAWLTCVATLLLICSGGMVTSKNVGLAVPYWPTTFGYNMFLFPVSNWVGGILFEHTHRLMGSLVGFLTIILAVWLWLSEHRRWMRNLGVIALVGVILQGTLGGLRVTMMKDELGIFHACVAQAFLAFIIGIAVIAFALLVCREAPRFAALKKLSILWVALVICQITLGAWTIWSNKAADVATAHVALGAGMLSFGVSISAICCRISQLEIGRARPPGAPRSQPVRA